MKKIWLVGIIVMVVCSKPEGPDVAGNGTKTGNAFITGTMVNEAGEPVEGVVVRLFPNDHIPSFASNDQGLFPTDTTNSKGEYGLAKVASGAYNIEGKTLDEGVFIDSVEIYDDSTKNKVPPGILKKYGSITGITHMAGLDDTSQVRVTLYMPGTERITKPNIGGGFNFAMMAEGAYQLIIDPTLNEYNVKVINIAVEAGKTLDLDTVFLAKYNPDTIEVKWSTVTGTWERNKVYRIFNDIEVPQGAVLDIKPGVKAEFVGNYKMDIFGTLNAAGQKDSMITFAYGYGAGEWVGLRSNDKGQGVDLAYCIFENAQKAIWLQSASYKPVIKNCIFRRCGFGVEIMGLMAECNIYNCIFHDITHNVNSYPYAIGLEDDGNGRNIQVVNNILMNCARGIWIVETTSNVTIANMCLYNNGYDFVKSPTAYPPMTSFTPSSMTEMVFEDPLITDLGEGEEDYSLKVGSPCLGTGINGTDMGVYSKYNP